MNEDIDCEPGTSIYIPPCLFCFCISLLMEKMDKWDTHGSNMFAMWQLIDEQSNRSVKKDNTP
jgi:hypothetical protein